MRDSLPSARYSPICNVLRQWKTSLIPIYRVYRLYDNKARQIGFTVYRPAAMNIACGRITTFHYSLLHELIANA